MTSLVNKLADWTPIYHKILIFFPTKSLKSLRAARIDELADSNKPAIIFTILPLDGFSYRTMLRYRDVMVSISIVNNKSYLIT